MIDEKTKPTNVYKHCLICGGNLKEIADCLQCTSCGYKHYINPAPCNAVIIENAKGEILLVERKFEPKKGEWDLPGGFIQPYESIEASSIREIREELNIEIKIGKIIGIYHDVYLYQGVNHPTICIVLTATLLSGTITPADDVATYKFFPKDQVLNQKIAFWGVKEGLRTYLNDTTNPKV